MPTRFNRNKYSIQAALKDLPSSLIRTRSIFVVAVRAISLSATALTSFLFVNIAKAETVIETGLAIPGGKKCITAAGKTTCTFSQYSSDIINFAKILGSSLAVLMVIYGGYKYLFSRGNSSATNEAKEIITGALLGLAVIYLIDVVIKFIGI
jgi:hypothetical protein